MKETVLQGLVLPYLLSEISGSKSRVLFEKINKVIYVVVTYFAAYLMDWPIRGKQHFFGFLKPPSNKVFDGRHAVNGGKFPAQPVFTDMKEIFTHFQRKGFIILKFKNIMHLD